jgi:predicted transcriptional regulator
MSMDAKRIALTADIAAAYVSNNRVPASALSALIADVFAALAVPAIPPPPAVDLTPAVPIRRSVQPDFIICLEDGKPFKSMKRHLAKYGLTPAAYRQKWGLPADYPMVAPNYAAKRSTLAKSFGLGVGRRAAATPDAPASAAQAVPSLAAPSVAAPAAKARRQRKTPVPAALSAARANSEPGPATIEATAQD